MSRVVASGCEIIATCDALTSTTVACARAAMNRSVAGGMALSCVATMYHDGIVLHAGSPDSDWNASFENGPLRRLHLVSTLERQVGRECLVSVPPSGSG